MISVRLNRGRHTLVGALQEKMVTQVNCLTGVVQDPFLSIWMSQPDVGVQEPDATVDDDTYDTGGAYYYVQPADDDQE